MCIICYTILTIKMDFNMICRLCCKQTDHLRSIIEVKTINLPNVFTDILKLKFSDEDGLPQKICRSCLSTLDNIYETVEYFRSNDKNLRLRLNEWSEIYIKEELIDTDEEQRTFTQQLEKRPFSVKAEEQKDVSEERVTHSDNEAIYEEWLSEYENQRCDTFNQRPFQNEEVYADMDKKNDTDVSKKKNGTRIGRPRTRFDDPNRPRLNDFKCYVCKSESMGTPDALRAHLEVHLDQLPYTCTICVAETIVINSITTLNIHKRMHENPYKCPQCDRCYANKRAVDGHIQSYHSEENTPSPSICDKCGKVCRSLTSLKYHERLHTSACACEFCGKLFVDRHKLRRHIERKHEKLKKYECYLCHKKLCSMDAVQVHFKTIHSTKVVNCEYCGKRYPSELSLRYHLKKHEKDPNSKFSCDWKNYYSEIVTGENKPSKKCNLCGAVVKAIAPHMRSVHFPKEYRCNICESVYKSKNTYDIHVLEHKFGKAHRCPICDKEFSEKKNLIAHLKTKKHRDHPLAKSLGWLDMKSEAGINQLKPEDTA
ncbi:zinc finger protein 33B-like [Wyeomyia smithii]|uniref:zinc finger protein 33B-like n=1 Tax=Wyeomyia smithii TaxID=174621 RepID=UPI002467ACF4|nr:zinc finger protein 33B-like [Wyeomyia smithii]